jgi:hypothetical protein
VECTHPLTGLFLAITASHHHEIFLVLTKLIVFLTATRVLPQQVGSKLVVHLPNPCQTESEDTTHAISRRRKPRATACPELRNLTSTRNCLMYEHVPRIWLFPIRVDREVGLSAFLSTRSISPPSIPGILQDNAMVGNSYCQVHALSAFSDHPFSLKKFPALCSCAVPFPSISCAVD